jgi:hypothetical protein
MRRPHTPAPEDRHSGMLGSVNSWRDCLADTLGSESMCMLNCRVTNATWRFGLNADLPGRPQGSIDWLQLIVRGSGGRAGPSNAVQLERPEHRRQ